MYSVKPYLDNFTVKPAKIIYNMPSYHQSTTGEFYDYNGSGNNENLNKEQRKEIYFEPICAQKIAAFSESDLNQKEHVQPESDENDQLVKRLKALSSRLDKFIATGSGKNAANSSTPNKKGSPPTPVMESGQNVQTNEQKGTELKKNEVKNADNKQDKKAERKEKREAAISAAKNKIPTQAISVDQQPKTKVVSSSTPTETELAQFVLKAPPANSPFLLHAKVQPTASVFPVHNYGIDPKQFADLKIKWTLKGRDKVLAKLLRKLGEKRRVQFVDGPMKKDNANGLVVYIEEATTDEEIKLEINGNQLPGELVCWKSLGTMLGLYSPDDVLISAKTDKWLLMAATANSRQQLEKFTRQMNAFLGENDFLSSQHAVCLADIVVRSLFVHQQNGELLSWQQVKAPNNVQLWIKRVDEALA